MKHFDKIKKQLRDEQTQLPDFLRWEVMEDNIMGKTSNDNEVSKGWVSKNLSSRFATKMPFILLAFLFGSALTYLFVKKEAPSGKAISESTEILSPNVNHENNTTVEDKLKVNYRLNPTISSTDNGVADNNSEDEQNGNVSEHSAIVKSIKMNIDNSNTNKNVANKHQTIQANVGQSDHNPLAQEINSLTGNPFVVEDKVQKSFEIKPTYEVNPFKEVNQSKENTNFAIPSESNQSTQDLEQIELIEKTIELNTHTSRDVFEFPFLPLLKMSTLVDGNRVVCDAQIVTTLSTPKVYSGSRFSMDIGMGINYWMLNPVDDTNNFYNNTNSESGTTFSGRVHYGLDKRWTLTSGFDISNFYNRLDVVQIGYQERLVENALTHVKYNAFYQQYDSTYADVMVIDTLVRTVRNHNTYKTMTIPVGIDYTLIDSDFKLNFGIGVAANLLRSYTGKYITGNEIVEFDKSIDVYATSASVGVLGNVNLQYAISRKAYVGVKLEGSKYLTSWGNVEGSHIKPLTLNGSFVIGTKF